MADTELPAVLCGYVYAKLLNPANEANAAPIRITVPLAALSAAVANYSLPPWTVVESGTYPCDGEPPPPPPIVSSPPPPPPPPPPPTCPDGQHWDATAGACVPDDNGGGTDNPPSLPPGGGGGDEISIMIQVLTLYLDKIIATIGNCCQGSGGSNPGGASDACCASIAAALSAIALAIQQLAAAARNSGSPGSGAPDFTSLVQALKAISDALSAWEPLKTALLEYIAELGANGASPGDSDCVCQQLTRIADRAARESDNQDGTIAALAGLDANIESLWSLVGAQ